MTRQLGWLDALGLLLLLVLAGGLRAESLCASTPAAAVLQGLGMGTAEGIATGYRVHDVVTDSTLHRTFVRVESCGHAERPLLLLPFAASGVAAVAPATTPPGISTQSAPSTTLVARASLPVDGLPGGLPRPPSDVVAAGTVVAVAMLDARVNLSVRGRLVRAASVGSDVDVELLKLNGSTDAPRVVHGRLMAADRVEVQP